MTAEELKSGIFLLNTRRFGKVAEVMIKLIKSLGKGKNIFHDLYDETQKQRVEVKFSTVRQSLPPITESNILESIQAEMLANRAVKFANWTKHDFWCNIQQVKKSEFEVLYYGLFFDDCIKIFRITPDRIDSSIGYNNKQHKGNVGEGQFHINPDTLQTHLDNYLVQTMSYQELMNLLTPCTPQTSV